MSEEGRAIEISAKAAAAFDMYFSELVRFDYMMEQLEQLLPDADDFPRHGIRNTQYRRVVARSASRRTRELVARLPIGRTERRRKG